MEKNCASVSFKALLTTQFIGAFVDNLLKVVISLYAIKILSSSQEASRYVSIIGVLYILPFVVFSPLAGYLADRFSKRAVIIVMGAIKIALALLAAWSLFIGNLGYLCAVLFLFMIESALFSPAKLGILP